MKKEADLERLSDVARLIEIEILPLPSSKRNGLHTVWRLSDSTGASQREIALDFAALICEICHERYFLFPNQSRFCRIEREPLTENYFGDRVYGNSVI